MTVLRVIVVGLMLAAGHAHAQNATRVEITFWESVRTSNDPAELQAYLDSYPDGVFVPLARMRLAALRPKPAAIAVPGMPQIGDTWAYLISVSDPKRGAVRRNVFVKVTSVSPTLIVETVSVEGGFTMPWRLARGGYLVAQGVSVLSPYLPQFEKLVPGGELGYIENTDPGCRGDFVCTAKGTVVGQEAVTVSAGRFAATKVIVQQSWRPAAGAKGGAKELARMHGSRTLTIWYAGELKRAVRYESRLVSGERTPLDANFDVELISYQLK
ncbi:MAG: hypothetical protein QOD26_665 [Betaproteobacteria bacterium]|nr:hypothetical protein [Betaproteobacteria bacterium]